MKTTMKKYLLSLLLAVFSLTTAAAAQEFPAELHEFLLAKLAAEEGRYDEALTRLDKVIAKNPADEVLLYERAMILLDAGRIERAETELRAVVQKSPDFYDGNRVLGRVLLDRAGSDRSKVEEALRYLQAAYKGNPDDLSTGITVAQILRSLNRTADAERVLAAMVERAPDQRALTFNYAQVLAALDRNAEPSISRAHVAIDRRQRGRDAALELSSGRPWHKAASAALIAEARYARTARQRPTSSPRQARGGALVSVPRRFRSERRRRSSISRALNASRITPSPEIFRSYRTVPRTSTM